MTRVLSASLLAFGLLAYMPIARATAGGFDGARRAHHGLHGRAHGVRGSSTDVPEFDPTAAAGALTLLAGAALVLGGRRRRAS